jgi:hypothetical protein
MRAVEEPEQKVRRAVRTVVTHLGPHPAHVRRLLRDLAQAGSGDAFEHVGRITHQIETEIDEVRARSRFSAHPA